MIILQSLEKVWDNKLNVADAKIFEINILS